MRNSQDKVRVIVYYGKYDYVQPYYRAALSLHLRPVYTY